MCSAEVCERTELSTPAFMKNQTRSAYPLHAEHAQCAQLQRERADLMGARKRPRTQEGRWALRRQQKLPGYLHATHVTIQSLTTTTTN